MSKKILIRLIALFAAVILIFLIFFSLPSNYKNNIKVNSHKIDAFKSKTPIAKVIVFSDIHLLYDYQVEDLDKLVTTINKQDPDIVIFNGDLFDSKSYKGDITKNRQVIKKLEQIKPLLGKFAVKGEQDQEIKEMNYILSNSDFEILNNVNRKVIINDKSFNIIALQDNAKALNVLKSSSDKSFNMVITHHPNLVDKVKDYKIDCLVTGHTLGGQYNLPIYGSIFKNIRDIPYYKGYNSVNGISVYNSNGIGTYNNNLRFNAPSSIEEFILY